MPTPLAMASMETNGIYGPCGRAATMVGTQIRYAREEVGMRRLFSFLIAALTAALCAVEPAGAETKLKMIYTAVTGFGSAYLAQEQASSKNAGSTSNSS